MITQRESNLYEAFDDSWQASMKNKLHVLSGNLFIKNIAFFLLWSQLQMKTWQVSFTFIQDCKASKMIPSISKINKKEAMTIKFKFKNGLEKIKYGGVIQQNYSSNIKIQ